MKKKPMATKSTKTRMLTDEDHARLEEFLKELEEHPHIAVFEMKIAVGDCHLLVRTDGCHVGGSTPNLEVLKVMHHTQSDFNGLARGDDE